MNIAIFFIVLFDVGFYIITNMLPWLYLLLLLFL